ncbi:MAG: hypothetical protein K8R99_02965 [Actinomycetia bacterium]|nr:hypothetical protein [Actinomycetes bacterium]
MTTANRALAARVAVAAGVALVIAAAVLQRRHSADHWPFDPWGFEQRLTWSLTTVGTSTTVIAGAWLWWRLPRNPTGCWVVVCGSAQALTTVGENWQTQFGVWCAALAPTMAVVASVLAVVRWPTAHLERRARSPFAAALAAYVAVCIVSQLLGTGLSRWSDASLVLPTAMNAISGSLVLVAGAAITRAVAPALLLAVMTRRILTLPVEMRREGRPVLLAVVVLALSELWMFIADGLLVPLGTREPLPSTVEALRDAVEATRFGAIALLLVVSEAMRRRRASAAGAHPGFIELGPLGPPIGASTEIARVLGDATAELNIAESDQSFVPSEQIRGAAMKVLHPDGRLLALVTHDPRLEVTEAANAALATTLELALVRRARQVEADRASANLHAMQVALVDAQDHARRALERDLHDAVQQRLVALTLQASLLARRETTAGRAADLRQVLLDGIEESIELVHQVVESGTPAAVSSGLARGLRVLAASTPLPTELEVVGDLAGDDPASAHLWFIAAEAVANALKHAQARHLWLRLNVNEAAAELSVADDGVGGVLSVPASIQLRSDALGAEATTRPSAQGGTTIDVQLDLSRRGNL